MAGQFTRSRRLETQQQEQSRARWTTSLTKILATLMVEQVHKGNKHNNLFNKKAWKYICDEFYSKTGLKWDKEQLKNRYSVLRRQYTIVKSILDQSDFSWDESTGSITANDEIWAEYIQVCSFIFCFVINKIPKYGAAERRNFEHMVILYTVWFKETEERGGSYFIV